MGLLAVVGLLAGLCNGLLGSGGGMILYFALSRMHYRTAKDRFVMNIAVVSVITTLSSLNYLARGIVSFSDLTPYVLPGITGGAAGAYLTRRLRAQTVKIVFAILTIWAGSRMFFT